MAKISTYPIISIPTANDLLIGTDVLDLNITKNFTVASIGTAIGSLFVPYIGATGNIDLGIYGITGSGFVVNGGLSSQFLKADGSLDSTTYVPQTRTLTINGTSYDLSADRSWTISGLSSLTTTGTGGAATYLSNVLNIPIYQSQGNYITDLSGEATASGPGNASVVLNNSAVIGKILTGLVVSGGTIVSTDTILQAFGKIQNQINGVVSGLDYQGTWNAATNTPLLQSSIGVNGEYYVVDTAGSTSLNGITSWGIGDWAIFNGTSWQKIDNSDSVSSVFGRTGAVTAQSGDYTTTLVTEGTNLYYLDSRARLAISSSATGLTYTTATGVFSLTGGYSIPTTASQGSWNSAYNDSIISASVTGTTTKTLTLNQQDGGTITASWTDLNTDAVTSVFGRTGAIVAQSGDYTTTLVTEGTNLYFLNSRARTAISLTTTGNSGAATYDNITGIFNVPNYTLSGLGGVPSTRTLTINGSAYDLSLDRSWSVGTVTSVGLTMPAAFTVLNSPVIGSGVISVAAAGTANQYIRGDGFLADFPSGGGGGGSSVSYYLNGSIPSTVVGYQQLDNVAIIGGGTDFTLVGNGLIAQFLTDVGNPNRIQIPGGAWNFEMYFQVSSSGGNSKFYVELYKYDGTTFTLIASSSTVPEAITGGTNIDLYLTSLAVPTTTLLTTDRLAVRVYIVDNSGGRTVTLHTEDNTLCEIITTFAGGVSSINGLTANTQYLATGTSGTDFNINSLVDTHTFNLPTASSISRGALSTTDWSNFNSKQNAITLTTTGNSGASTFISNTLNVPNYTLAGLGGVPITRTLTINGTALDLSADRSWSVGTVTSVDMSVPTGFAISGNPVTSTGTLALSFAAGYSLPSDATQSTWTTAYNNSIVSAAVTGTTTKTLTLTQQDAGTVTASWTDDAGPFTAGAGTCSTIRSGVSNTATASCSAALSGSSNTASGTNSIVAGGTFNTASGSYSTIGGGYGNGAFACKSTIGGGSGNGALGLFSTVGGGYNNTASGYSSTIGGGKYNIASGPYSTIGGGCGNCASYNYSFIGGGCLNNASGASSTIGGGKYNIASGPYSTIGGGSSNCASYNHSFIGGGCSNIASGLFSTIGGGCGNCASSTNSIVAGGCSNIASGPYSTIGGGCGNGASGYISTIAGGCSNIASGLFSTIGGGIFNTSSYCYSFIGGGNYNTASGTSSTIGGGRCNTASGYFSSIMGGSSAVASRHGQKSFASGIFAANGDAQQVDFVARNKTVDGTPVTLFLNGSNARLTITSGTAMFLTVNVGGIKSDGSAAAHYIRKVAIKNVGGTTALIGTVSTIGTDVEDNAAYDVTITADNTNDALQINVTGLAAETLRWVSHIQGIEIAYGT